ncbi:MAG: hypothetical protein EA397_14310 [Deltaproteobacteria bacterium]|nr:MAG: hypothetical protein EA397_14310 [Deltaproteobacteria bacterium]
MAEATGDQLRAGRFVHVLASGRRRQSYSMSRIDDDRLQRLDDSRWTELQSFTEFGLRYLDLPDLSASAPVVAAVQVSANPAPARASGPATTRTRSVNPAPGRSVTPATARSATPASARTASPAQPRGASSAAVSTANPAASRGHSPKSQPRSVQPELAAESIKRMSTDQLRATLQREMHTVQQLNQLIERLEGELEASRERERDLIEVISKWQSRG